VELAIQRKDGERGGRERRMCACVYSHGEHEGEGEGGREGGVRL